MIGFYNYRDVRRITGGKQRMTLWRWERQGRFPAAVKLAAHAVGWRIEEVDEWAADPQGWAERRRTVGTESVT